MGPYVVLWFIDEDLEKSVEKRYFYWNIVALHYHVSFFLNTAKWISYTYMYIPSFLDFLPIWVTTKHWVGFPEL